MTTELSQINKFYRGFILVVVVGFALTGIVTCTKSMLDYETRVQNIRDENNGVLPGQEALDQKGNRYQVKTIQHNGNTYTCFSDDYRRIGCAKE